MAEFLFQFGDFRIDDSAAQLLRGGQPVHIQPKPFALLVHLFRNRDRVVSKQELLDTVWPDVSVSDLALFSALRDLRRTLGDTDTAERTIRTVRGRGFRFVADVRPMSEGGAPAAATAPAPSPPASLASDFVDRKDAMATLLASLDAAKHGALRVSFIAGAGGMGKTRLTTELAREAARESVSVQLGRCIDREGAAPFSPWLEIMRGLLTSSRTSELAQSTCDALSELAPLADVSLPARMLGRADLDRTEARLRFFEAFGVLLQRVSDAQPLLLVIDDLQWADEASLLLFDYLITALHSARIHLVAAFRDPPRPERTLARVLATGARQSFTERIDLQGLGRDAVRVLLENAADRPAAPEVVEAILAATSGNALFVSELAKLVAHGELEVADLPKGLPVPRRVRDVLRWQFDRLSPACQRVLQALAVVGGRLELAVLVRTAGDAQGVVLESLSEAEAAGLAVGGDDGRFGFVHDLVRESIYRDLSVAARPRLHRKMAQALEATTLRGANADLSQVAYHYSLGLADGAADQAVRFGYLAGQQANERMAYEDAVAHYQRALNALAVLDSADPKLGCEIALAQAEAAWGTSEDAASVQQRFVVAAENARAARQAELFARAALGRSGHGVGPGDFREVLAIDEVDIALLNEADAVLGADETELRALVLARLALAVRYAKPFAVAEKLSAEAVRIAETISAAPAVLAEVLRYRHEVLSGPEYAHERVRLADRVLALARAVRSRPLEIDALTFQSRNCFEVLDFAGSHAAVVAVNALDANMKHPGSHFRGGIRHVTIMVMLGELNEAERLARQFYERDAARNIGAGGTFEIQTYRLASLRGDHKAALAALVLIDTRVRNNLAWAHCAIARELALSGDELAARFRLDAFAANGFRRITDHHELATLACFYLLAETCAALGDKAHAQALYGRLLPFAEMMAAPFLAVVWQGSMAHALGLLATVLEQGLVAERHFERALAIGNSLASPPLVAITAERFGALLLSRNVSGDRARGLELVTRAGAIAERIGMNGIARACSDLLRSQERAPSSRATPAPDAPRDQN
jgi:DNA-binding winged helix-turn-helix (wHTH) protein